MTASKSFFSVMLLLILIGLGWYLWTQTDLLTQKEITSLTNQAEDVAYERCVNIAKREYAITSTEGDNDLEQTALEELARQLKACDETYGR